MSVSSQLSTPTISPRDSVSLETSPSVLLSNQQLDPVIKRRVQKIASRLKSLSLPLDTNGLKSYREMYPQEIQELDNENPI